MDTNWMQARRWTRLTAVSLFLITFAMLACNGDGCGGCDIDGFAEEPFPESHEDKTVPHSAEVRVTSHAFEFIEQEADNLVDEMLDDGLSFCIPPTYTDDADLCHEGVQCADGSDGCQVDLELEDVQVNPEAPNQIIANVTIGDLHKDEDIPVTIHTWPDPDCWLDLYGSSSSDPASIPATLPLEFSVEQESVFNDIRVDVGDVTVDIDNVNYSLHNRDGSWGCGMADLILDWFLDGTLRDMIADEVDDMVDDMTREQLCRGCSVDADCPDNADCVTDDDVSICMYDQSADHCVPTLLGIEGILEMDELLGEFLPGGASDVYLTGRVADEAVADTGLKLDMRIGAEPETDTLCAPVDRGERPSFDTPPGLTAMEDDYTPGGEQYMVGVGIHERSLDHVLWSAWASGGLCAEVGYDEVDMLSTNMMAPLVDGIDELVSSNAPMAIRLTPQQAPRLEVGDNEVDDGDIIDGLLTLQWDELDVHIYGFLQERYARLFTLRIDMELPIAMVVDGDDALVPVIGDIEEGLDIDGMQVMDDQLVLADEEELRDLIPTLLGLAVPQMLDDLEEPIELPELMGYKLVIDEEDLGELEKEYLALFADLEYVGTDPGQLHHALPRATVTGYDLIIDRADGGFPDVSATLDVNAELSGIPASGGDVEFLYRLGDRGIWSTAGFGPRLTIDHPVLALQGEHQLQLRARLPDQHTRWQREPTTVELLVDYEPPTVEAWQSEHQIIVAADDAVDTIEQMQQRWRFVGDDIHQDWTRWSSVGPIDLTDAPDVDGLGVDIQVRDRTGHVTDDSVDVRRTALDGEPADEPVAEQPRGGGCTAGGTTTTGFAAVAMMLLVLVALRKRRRIAAMIAITATAAILFTGCGGCGDDTTDGEKQENQWEMCDCEYGEVCIDEECVVPECDELADCEDVECEADHEVAICAGGNCLCVDPCAGQDCSSTEFCCLENNRCQELPDPCDPNPCDPGYKAEVVTYGDFDARACTAEEGECECKRMDPIPMGYHGAYLSIDEGGGVTALAAYNLRYGDLMVGEIKQGTIDRWHFVDGVPADGNIAGDPYGPRGGINTSGPDAGTHTAIAVDDQARIHVVYRHESDDALRYARGVLDDEYSFDTITLEEGDDTGYYSDVVLRDDTLEIIYTARVGDEDSEIRHRSIAVDEPIDDATDGDADVLHTGSAPAPDLEDYPRVAGLFINAVEDADGQLFVSFFDNTRGDVGWMHENDDGWADITWLDADAPGPYAVAIPDDDGTVHVAYMDGTDATLKYRAGDDDPEYVVDGIRDLDDAYSQSPVGHDVQLYLHDDHVEVFYSDPSIHELRRVIRDADGWAGVETIAGEGGSAGPAQGMYPRAVSIDDDRYVVDFSVDTTDEDNPFAEPTIWVVD